MTSAPAITTLKCNRHDNKPSSGCPLTTIGEVCLPHSATRDPRREPDWVFRYIDISSVDNKRKVITGARSIAGRDAPSRARQVVHTGDIIVATTRPNLNAVAMVPPELENSICSTGFCVLRSNGQVDREYLFAFVQSTAFVNSLSDLVKGALYPAVTDSQVRDQTLPLPPLPEQRRIAACLRERLAEVNKARTAVQAQVEAAERLHVAQLRAVFTSPAVQCWPRKPIGELCELLSSKSIALAGDTEVRAVTSACLTEDSFHPAGVKTARMWSVDAHESLVRPGEILVARSNTPELVGRTSIYKGDPKGVVASDLTIRLWPGPHILGDFLARYLSFLYTTGYWRERAGGASGTMKKITRSQITAEHIPLPSMAEQRSAASRLEAELSAISALQSSLSNRLSALDHLPSALLREAFAGRI